MPLNIIRNDITAVQADAIVNPTNSRLNPGGGVDAAIHAAAGPELAKACRALAPLAPGSAAATDGYGLNCRYIIHTVGPRWYDGNRREKELLHSCYRKSLHLACQLGCHSIAFPVIASGSFGFPKEQALYIAVDEIRSFLSETELTVWLVVYDETAFRISSEKYRVLAAYIDQEYVDAHPAIENRRAEAEFLMSPCAAPMEDNCFDCAPAAPSEAPRASAKLSASRPGRRRQEAQSLEEMMRRMDESFSQMLLRLIDEKGMTDSQCYKKAGIDRKLFSKIRSDPQYRPSKVTVLAFAIALELDLEDTRDMLMKAGFALSRSNKFDIIIEYHIRQGCYDFFTINEALYAFDQALIGV